MQDNAKFLRYVNLGEERNVGFLNYELDIRGKQNLEAASCKMVLNKSADLISKSVESFKTFRKPAAAIKEIRLAWNKKMKEMEEKGFSKADLKNKNLEKTKLEDIDFLGKQVTPGPFTTSDDVKNLWKANLKVKIRTGECTVP